MMDNKRYGNPQCEYCHNYYTLSEGHECLLKPKMTNSQDSVEQSEEEKAAREYCDQFCWNDPREEDAYDAFLAGIEWERKRNKWIDFEKEKPPQNKLVLFIDPKTWQICSGFFWIQNDGVEGWTNESEGYVMMPEQEGIVKWWYPIPIAPDEEPSK